MITNFEIRNFVPAPAHLCVTSTVQQSVLSPEMSVLQQLVLHLDVSVQQQPVLCQKMPTAACGAPGQSVYKSQCCTETCLSTKSFMCT